EARDALKEERGKADRKAEEKQSIQAEDKDTTSSYGYAVPPSLSPFSLTNEPAPTTALAPGLATSPLPVRMAGVALSKPEKMPSFPWPVPKASASYDVPRQLIIGNTSTPTLGSVAERIANALDHAGYGERSYYALAGGHGVAIATQ